METSQTVARALHVLTCFDDASPELSAAEIARRLALPRTIVVRLVGTLCAAGFLERNARDARYRVGLAAFEVGSRYVAANPLFDAITADLERLANETGYTGYFGVMDGGELVIIAHVEGRLPVRFVWSAGDRLPATTTAIGKAMLAHMAQEAVDRLVGRKRLAGLTERSLSRRDELDAQLVQARRHGWASARDESSIGITAVGAAVLEGEGQPIGGISLSFLDYPPDAQRVARVAELVRAAASALSQRAGSYAAYGHRLATVGATKKRPPRIT